MNYSASSAGEMSLFRWEETSNKFLGEEEQCKATKVSLGTLKDDIEEKSFQKQNKRKKNLNKGKILHEMRWYSSRVSSFREHDRDASPSTFCTICIQNFKICCFSIHSLNLAERRNERKKNSFRKLLFFPALFSFLLFRSMPSQHISRHKVH